MITIHDTPLFRIIYFLLVQEVAEAAAVKTEAEAQEKAEVDHLVDLLLLQMNDKMGIDY